MQESAGNEYQGLSIGSAFAVQLVATQDTVESDNFDDQYDINANYPTVAAPVDTIISAGVIAGAATALEQDGVKAEVPADAVTAGKLTLTVTTEKVTTDSATYQMN